MAIKQVDEFSYGFFEGNSVVYADHTTNYGVALTKVRLNHSFWNNACKSNGSAYSDT
ncbi:MAG: hypothetical protein HFF02_08355 [Erysipelotrichaceae bacterium]|nr:hypothetical protein [Erysipelotrichaceae bacterium]